MKKGIAVLLIALLLAALCAPALAASFYLDPNAFTVNLHPGEDLLRRLQLKNAGDVAIADVKDIKTTGKDNVGYSVSFSKESVELSLKTNDVPGQSVTSMNVLLSNGATKAVKVTVNNQWNYAPKIRWYHVMPHDSGYPMIKLSMSDDYGMTNVCFVRTWTENGVEQKEIYDIVSLGEQTTAVCFHTLKEIGTYSVQINDGTEKRFNSKALAVVLDTDGDGYADSYYDAATPGEVMTFTNPAAPAANADASAAAPDSL